MKTLLTPPAVEPVSLATAKKYLRVDHADDDDLIQILISAARQAAEHETGRIFGTSSWRIVELCFPDRGLPLGLNLSPVQSITSITYKDKAGTEQTLQDYTLWPDDCAPAILPPPAGWPALGSHWWAVTIEVVAGFAVVPLPVVQWMLLRIGTAYENREALIDGRLQEMPRNFVNGLLDPYRVVRV